MTVYTFRDLVEVEHVPSVSGTSDVVSELDFFWIVLSIIGLAFVFHAVYVVCDEHLVPAIEVLIDQYDIPEEVAAVTLVAFSSAAPEILLNCASAADHASSLSLPATLGSGMIAFGMIPPCCVLLTHHQDMTLSTHPIFRESLFYIFGLVLFLWIIQDDVASAWEAGALVSIYAVYVGLVLYLYMYGKETEHHIPRLYADGPEDSAESSALVQPGGDAENGLQRRQPAGDGFDQDPASGAVSSLRRISTSVLVNSEKMFFLSRPVIEFLVPPLRPQSSPSRNPLFRYISSLPTFAKSDEAAQPGARAHDVTLLRVASIFLISVALIGVLSSMLLNLVQYSLNFVALDSSTVSATLMALGSEIPDTINSVSLARAGHFDAAMAGAIGSQVINITIGIGLPLLMLSLFDGEGVAIKHAASSSLDLLISLLLTVVAAYICTTIPVRACLQMRLPETSVVTKRAALFHLLYFAFAYLVFIIRNEQKKDDVSMGAE